MKIWQWRNKGCHPSRSWRTIGDGSRPDHWWLQMEYREIEKDSELYRETTDIREIVREGLLRTL